MENQNFACRIFKEQMDLILQLPEDERAEVLYKAVLYGFNQIENQNENQNECAYVSVSVSVFISVLSKKIFNLLCKNIVWKKFSNNYGGKRINSGRKSKNVDAVECTTLPCESVPETKSAFRTPTLEEVIAEANLQNSMAGVGGYKITPESAELFYTTYAATDWKIHNQHQTPIRDWKSALRGWAIKKQQEKLAELEKDGIPIAPKPFRDDSKNAKK